MRGEISSLYYFPLALTSESKSQRSSAASPGARRTLVGSKQERVPFKASLSETDVKAAAARVKAAAATESEGLRNALQPLTPPSLHQQCFAALPEEMRNQRSPDSLERRHTSLQRS